jgi:hypothetical protein
MGCGFPTVCGVVAWPVSVPDTQRAGNGWKRLVSLAGRPSCSCFVRLCVSEGRFVTSGLDDKPLAVSLAAAKTDAERRSAVTGWLANEKTRLGLGDEIELPQAEIARTQLPRKGPDFAPPGAA